MEFRSETADRHGPKSLKVSVNNGVEQVKKPWLLKCGNGFFQRVEYPGGHHLLAIPVRPVRLERDAPQATPCCLNHTNARRQPSSASAFL